MLERESTSRRYQPMVLSSQQRTTYQGLSKVSRSLAEMYLGAIIALDSSENPEKIPQAAHSIRELMEKFPQHVGIHREQVGVVINKLNEAKGPWHKAFKSSRSHDCQEWKGEIGPPLSEFLGKIAEFFSWYNNRPSRTELAKRFIQYLRPSESPTGDNRQESLARLWVSVDRFFIDVSHHKLLVNQEQFEEELLVLESILLYSFSPSRRSEDYDQIDRLIVKGEGNAHR